MLDVCLLLEGTYPYVAGGVSTWVHQLVSAMKDIRFGIVYIAPHPDPTRTLKYTLPQNIIYLKEVYLHDYHLEPTAVKKPTAKNFTAIKALYNNVLNDRYEGFKETLEFFRGPTRCLDAASVFSSRETWNILTDFYDTIKEDVSFLDFFWTWRGTHLPLVEILTAEIPAAKVYHAVSTGYAGLLGCVAKATTGGKLFLTEHGIYTHERMLEISQAQWIYEKESEFYRVKRELSFFKRWWVSLFRVISGLCYAHCDRIFTLYEGNKLRQITEGAVAEKITVIPNGIGVKDFENLPPKKGEHPCVGLIGRVVGIKDIKTFIQAAKFVVERLPETEFYIIGPTDEEEEYFEECQSLVASLELEDKVHFTGRIDIQKALSMLDIVVLTSISEAQPYVILEAGIAGLPVVATDVGACREMIEGQNEADKSLGKSGLVTEVSNPEATAQAIMSLITDKNLYQKLAITAKMRVKKYYDQDDCWSRYLNVYEQSL